jgi:plasmid stabilization system protein ParE
MEVGYHPLVRVDVEEALTYYQNISPRLADEFHAELRSTINRATENPLRFHLADQGFRRANLKRFPYHLLYEARPEYVRVMLVRHNKRHPLYGLSRE